MSRRNNSGRYFFISIEIHEYNYTSLHNRLRYVNQWISFAKHYEGSAALHFYCSYKAILEFRFLREEYIHLLNLYIA